MHMLLKHTRTLRRCSTVAVMLAWMVSLSAASAPLNILQRQVPLPASTDQSVEVAVALGYSTMVILPATIAAEGLHISASAREFFRPRVQGSQLTLSPERLPGPGEESGLSLTLVDKTQVRLRLVQRPARVDGRLEIVRSETPEQARLRFVSAALEQCQAESASTLLVRLALQERERPDAGLRPLRLPEASPKSSLAVLQALQADFMGRVVLLVEVLNTHPKVAWAPEKAAIGLMSVSLYGVEVLQAEPARIPPGQKGWVGLSWRHPILRTEPFHLSLFGNGGTQAAEVRNLVLDEGPP
jgi:hypothetical protein